MVKKRKLVFDKTTYVFDRHSIGGGPGQFTQTFRIYIDKEYSGYSLVAECIGFSSDTKYTLYTAGKVVSEIGISNMHLPFEMVAKSVIELEKNN
jgi:hypothetical protein